MSTRAASVGDVLVQSRSSSAQRRRAGSRPGPRTAVTMNSGPPAGTTRQEPGRARARSGPVRPRRQCMVPIVRTPDSRAATTRGPSDRREARAGVGVPAVDELTRVVTDEFDQRRDAQRLADVVHVDHQGGDTRQHEDVRCRHGDARNLPRAVAPVQRPRGSSA